MVPNTQYAPQCVYNAVQLHTMTYYEFKHNISKIYQNKLCHTIQYHNQNSIVCHSTALYRIVYI